MSEEQAATDVISMIADSVNEEAKFDHEWNQKVWGQTKNLVRSPYYYRFELKLTRNTYCSYHYHNRRANKFSVESGVVKLVWSFGPKIRWTILSEGRDYIIDSLVPHQFQVLADGVMFEEYFSDRSGEIFEDDIMRISSGGQSDLVQRNEGLIFNANGEYWNGEVPWTTLPSSASTIPPSLKSD